MFDDSDDDIAAELTPVVTVTSAKDDNSSYKVNKTCGQIIRILKPRLSLVFNKTSYGYLNPGVPLKQIIKVYVLVIQTTTDTPVLSRKFHVLGINTQQTRKRPSPTRDDEESTPLIKRRRGVGRFRRYQSLDLPSKSQSSPVTCNPETEAHIKTTLDRGKA